MRLLLVDDESEFVSALSERIEMRGIACDGACTAEEAVRRVRRESYDLAVLDVKMPGIGGIKLKKILQENCPEMKFIFLTGHGSEESFQAGSAETGAENYLLKPVRIEDLLSRIRAFLKSE